MDVAETGGFSTSSSTSSDSSTGSNSFLTPNDFQGTSPRDATESSGESSLSSSTSSSSLSASSPTIAVKLIQFRGHSVAAFDVDGKEMICLPQVR
uniref:Ski_Sno domain-containing protein n=2 Tax=Caenorhabditis tropicalis TaxID=1561998 RepID=A0A1I7TEJ2_9PELO